MEVEGQRKSGVRARTRKTERHHTIRCPSCDVAGLGVGKSGGGGGVKGKKKEKDIGKEKEYRRMADTPDMIIPMKIRACGLYALSSYLRLVLVDLLFRFYT